MASRSPDEFYVGLLEDRFKDLFGQCDKMDELIEKLKTTNLSQADLQKLDELIQRLSSLQRKVRSYADSGCARHLLGADLVGPSAAAFSSLPTANGISDTKVSSQSSEQPPLEIERGDPFELDDLLRFQASASHITSAPRPPPTIRYANGTEITLKRNTGPTSFFSGAGGPPAAANRNGSSAATSSGLRHGAADGLASGQQNASDLTSPGLEDITINSGPFGDSFNSSSAAVPDDPAAVVASELSGTIESDIAILRGVSADRRRSSEVSAAAAACVGQSSVSRRITAPKFSSPKSGEVEIKIADILDPSRFYCLVPMSDKGDEKFRQLFKAMHDYYMIASNLQHLTNDLSALNCNKPACVVIGPDDSTCRGTVLDAKVTDGQIVLRVLLVDYGVEISKPWDIVWVLADQFCEIPRRCLRCKLSGIKPRGSKSWSPEAINEFKQIAASAQTFKAIMLVNDENVSSEPVELIVMYRDGTSASTIHEALVMRGFAFQTY